MGKDKMSRVEINTISSAAKTNAENLPKLVSANLISYRQFKAICKDLRLITALHQKSFL